ncbi:MAG: gluconate 2-dehydrogenase subunit 3 family protein [Proteobacteria bacterium]|nr:gluconate 2-dehydrogenase subunit 3 family protein [Pseudomonadota bacterium]NOG59331.1 gluconate 2-dehydrogenase subunit 3 family protein [Pseudomonadota bacterium]
MSNRSKRFAVKAGQLYSKAKLPDQGQFVNWLNRRTFLKKSSKFSLLTFFAACNLSTSASQSSSKPPGKIAVTDKLSTRENYFTNAQRKTLDAVQMQLFPDDGDGPGARDLNAINYLEFAMTDPQNKKDGDPEFLAQGIGWLDDLSKQSHGNSFIKLSDKQQDDILKKIAKSRAGENWLSLLMYYLTEALMLDPVYGGNPEMIGWKWLGHQAGFPRPVAEKTYRDFE